MRIDTVINNSLKKWIVILVAFVCVLFWGTSTIFAAQNFDTVFNPSGNAEKMVIAGHRGDKIHAPENTIPAFEAAIKAGADMIELDVTQTKDGELVVMHDDNLSRIFGVNKNIWDVTYDELKTMDAGASFGAQFAGTKAPTLQEVLSLCKGKVLLDIELKHNGHEQADFVPKVVKLIEHEGFVNSCFLSSFYYNFLSQVKQENARISTGYILNKIPEVLPEYADADAFCVSVDDLKKYDVKKIHKQKRYIFAWNVNEKYKIDYCKEAKVDGIISNDPGYAKSVAFGYDTVQ